MTRPQGIGAEGERYPSPPRALNQLDWCIAYLHRIRKPSQPRAKQSRDQGA